MLDRVWILLVVVLGSAITAAAVLAVAGIVAGNKDQARIDIQTIPKTARSQRVATAPGKTPTDSRLLFEPPTFYPDPALDSPAAGPASVAKSTTVPEPGAKIPVKPASTTTTSERFDSFKAEVIKSHDAITRIELDAETGGVVVDIVAEGGLFEPSIDNEMQLNARRILRGAVLKEIVPEPIKSVTIRYTVDGKPGALGIAWQAVDILEIDWLSATFPQMMDRGKLANLSRPARDMVRNYCAREGEPKAPLCTTAYRHKLLQ